MLRPRRPGPWLLPGWRAASWKSCACRHASSVASQAPWPDSQPRFRLHSPGEEEATLLPGLPPASDVEGWVKRWRRRVPCPDPWAPVEGLYILCLYARAGGTVNMGRYQYRLLVDHVLWTSLERPRLLRERGLPAPTLLLAAYALTRLRQKETLQRLLPALREAVDEATSAFAEEQVRLLPNEVSKLAWVAAATGLSDDPLLPFVGELSLKMPGMTSRHLVQVAMALAGSGSDALRPVLEAVLCRVLPDASKETYRAVVESEELRSGDIQGLAFSLLRGAADVELLAPRLLAAAEALGHDQLTSRCKVVLYRAFDHHRKLLQPSDVATVEALYSEVMRTLESQLEKAAQPSDSTWAQAEPDQFRAAFEDLQVSEVDAASVDALLSRVGIVSDWPIQDKEKPTWEAEAEDILWRVRQVPVLEAHPVPDRGQTFGHVEWSLRCVGGATPSSSHGQLILRSGWGYDRSPNGREDVVRRVQSVEPLVPLVLDGWSREVDSEIQALAAVLREAKRLECLGPEIVGEVSLLVDQTPCMSCIAAMAQFRALLPKVQVRCHFVRLSARRRAERDQLLPAATRVPLTYSIYEGAESAATMSGSEPSGGPSLDGALAALRIGLREAGAEEDLCHLLHLEPAPDCVQPSQLLPLSLMLPCSGAFHTLIRLALKERRLSEALGLLQFVRRKGVPIFARTFEDLARDGDMHPRKAMGFIAEMEAMGLAASRRLVSAVLTRAARFGLAPAILRLRCRQFVRVRSAADAAATKLQSGDDPELEDCFRPGSSSAPWARPLLFLQLPNSGAISSCISRTEGHLAPRWAKALGIWAALRFYEEDAKTPFRLLLAVSGIIKQDGLQAAPAATCTHAVKRAVVQSLRDTGLLERMLTKRALTLEEELRVQLIEIEA